MAREEDDFRTRRRKREEEDQREKPLTGSIDNTIAISQKIDELITRATPLIEATNSSYNQYFSGAELRPPLERRKQLEGIMNMLYMIQKPNETYRFKVSTIMSHFNTVRDRWDRRTREIEQGKLKRSVPRRSSA
jgi:hypothetical protein